MRMVKLFEQTGSRQNCEPFVARVTTNPRLPLPMREREVLVLSGEDFERNRVKGFRACLVVGDVVEVPLDGRVVMSVSAEMDHLTDGDIVYLNPPAGTLSVLYRRHSPHNTIVPTEMCNCRCTMCPQPPRESDEAGWIDVCLQAIRLMSPETGALGVSGGEPTMLPEGLLEIIRACRDCLPETAVQVLTNGRMFNYLGYAREMSAIDHADLVFGVPVYSDLAQEHDRIVGVRGAFDETVRGIMNLSRCGQRVEIRVVVMRPNVARLTDLARFITRNLPFAEHVALMGMEPMGLADLNFERLWVDPADYQTELTAAVEQLRRHGIAVSVFNEQLCVLHPSIRTAAARSISDWKNVYLDECRGCASRDECGGFFESSRGRHSRAIRAL